jgi:hypothetical protein
MEQGSIRLNKNIRAGIRVIHSNPDMLASYCRCAADELAMWSDRMERQKDQKRDDL